MMLTHMLQPTSVPEGPSWDDLPSGLCPSGLVWWEMDLHFYTNNCNLIVITCLCVSLDFKPVINSFIVKPNTLHC